MDIKDAKDKPGGKKLFQPGNLANPSGRPKGTPNKITSQMREAMHQLFRNNEGKFQEKLDQLKDPKDWLNFMSKLFPYYMPTLTATKSEVTHKHTGAEHLSTEQLHELILTLRIPNGHTDDTEHTESD